MIGKVQNVRKLQNIGKVQNVGKAEVVKDYQLMNHKLTPTSLGHCTLS